jgi:SNF2 family DNA or RNA helicase
MKIELLSNQTAHVDALMRVLDKHGIAFDFSMLGTGKTFTSSHIALTKGYKHVVVIAPLSVTPKWGMMKKDYNVPIHTILGFCALRSVKGKQPKHGLLSRRDFNMPYGNAMVETVEFAPTELLKSITDEGALLVIDEIQNIKNSSAQFEACKTLIREFGKNKKSSTLLLSGSPIDKEEQVIRLFKTMGVFTADKLSYFDIQKREMVWTGLREIVNYANKIDPRFIGTGNVNNKTASGPILHKFVYSIFKDIVRPKMSSSMIPMKSNVVLHKKNGYFGLQDSGAIVEMFAAIEQLGSITGYNKTTQTVNIVRVGAKDGKSFAAIQLALVRIENAKTDMFYRLASDALKSSPNKKVVICVNFTSTLNALAERLREYNPLLLQGETPAKKRGEVIDCFQKNDTSHRLLIGNASVCSTGIDLDDKDGKFPRVAFISPNYSTITLYQLSHRFYRADTKSDATVFFVYAKECQEISILNALSRKSLVMKDATPEQVDAGVVFPVDMETHIEV